MSATVTCPCWRTTSPAGVRPGDPPSTRGRPCRSPGCKDSSGDAERLALEADELPVGLYTWARPRSPCRPRPSGASGAILALANADPDGCARAWAGDGFCQRELIAGHRGGRSAASWGSSGRWPPCTAPRPPPGSGDPATVADGQKPRSESRPTVTPGWSATCFTASRTPGMKRGAVVAVVADGEGLARSVPSRTSWWATRPRSRTEWTWMPPAPSPPRAPSTTSSVGGVGGPVGRRRGHALGGVHRRARRGVDLVVVVQLDDLGGLEERRGQLGEAHHQHGADGEVGGDHAVARR